MPKGVTIPEAMCWTVVRMTLSGFTSGQIHYLTEVSHRQQQRIMKIWRETDDVIHNANRLPRGRPRHLSADDVTVRLTPHICLENLIVLVQFLLGSIGSNCDAYLDELRDSLSVICGKEVSKPTVWRALRRCGYRMKKVSNHIIWIFELWPILINHCYQDHKKGCRTKCSKTRRFHISDWRTVQQ